MKLARKLSILALLLVGAEASLAADEPWTAYVNSRMFDTTDPDSGVDAVKADSRELSIEANNGHFWIGRPASVYCPSGVDKLDCSIYKTNQTVFVGANDFGDGTVSLNVVVPGGQQVYIAPDGALGYTTAHSASMPEGSEVAAFGRAALTVGPNAQLVLWTSTGDFEACPSAESGSYQIFVRVQGDKRDGCTLIMIRTRPTNVTSAWQYG